MLVVGHSLGVLARSTLKIRIVLTLGLFARLWNIFYHCIVLKLPRCRLQMTIICWHRLNYICRWRCWTLTALSWLLSNAHVLVLSLPSKYRSIQLRCTDWPSQTNIRSKLVDISHILYRAPGQILLTFRKRPMISIDMLLTACDRITSIIKVVWFRSVAGSIGHWYTSFHVFVADIWPRAPDRTINVMRHVDNVVLRPSRLTNDLLGRREWNCLWRKLMLDATYRILLATSHELLDLWWDDPADYPTCLTTLLEGVLSGWALLGFRLRATTATVIVGILTTITWLLIWIGHHAKFRILLHIVAVLWPWWSPLFSSIYYRCLSWVNCDVLGRNLLLTWKLLNMINVYIIYSIVVVSNIQRKAIFVHQFHIVHLFVYVLVILGPHLHLIRMHRAVRTIVRLCGSRWVTLGETIVTLIKIVGLNAETMDDSGTGGVCGSLVAGPTIFKIIHLLCWMSFFRNKLNFNSK